LIGGPRFRKWQKHSDERAGITQATAENVGLLYIIGLRLKTYAIS